MWLMDVDGENGIDLVVVGKNDGVEIGWFEVLENFRFLEEF